MTRHLQACHKPLSGPKTGQAAQGKPDSFHLFVEARYNKNYWLHLAIREDGLLLALDLFLRGIWLECCGHLSAFTIGGVRYMSSSEFDDMEPGEANMGARLNTILEPGMVFGYEYDFGSTTELTVKVAGMRNRTIKREAIELLAQNDPPRIVCEVCGEQPAARICPQCAWSDEGWLCGDCADSHECDPEMLLPVVNSPRAGVCAYAG